MTLNSWARFLIAAVLTVPWLMTPAFGAVNSATGGIGGVNNGTLSGGDGTGTAQFEIVSTELALVKQARDLDGNVLADGQGVIPGHELWFVIYVDNPTNVAAGDIRIMDLLDDAQFRYIPGTLQEFTQPTGATQSEIWGVAWNPVSDAVGLPDDVGSATDTGGQPGADLITFGAEGVQPNMPVDVPAQSIRAFRFRVEVR